MPLLLHAPFVPQAGTALQELRRLIVPIHVTLELTVMGVPSLLLLQLAPLAMRATTQVQLLRELLVVLYAE